MNPEELKNRTKNFALRVLNLADKLPRGVKGRVLSDQLARAGTSAAANYRAACKARSRAEFVAKMGVPLHRLNDLQQEARELTAIFAASRKFASRGGK